MPGVCLCHKEIDRFPSSSTAPKSEILGPEEPMRTLRLFVVATKKLVEGRKADKNRLTKILGKLFKNLCSQAELNKIVPFGFSLQRQKWCFFAIKIV